MITSDSAIIQPFDPLGGMVDSITQCYIYGPCLPLQTYILTDKWVTVQKHLRTSLVLPLLAQSNSKLNREELSLAKTT